MQNENFDEEIEKELDKRMDELKKNLNAKRKKRIIKKVILFASLGFISDAFIIMILSFIGFIDWFENYNGMYMTELPVEEPARGGSLYIPNEWEFVEDDGWYSIVDKTNNRKIAYEIYHGFRINTSKRNENNDNIIDYELNPILPFYESLSFERGYSSVDANTIFESEMYYKISISSVCSFKSPSLQDRNYSKEYLFVKDVDYGILKKIVRSYKYRLNVE